jgi:sugar lactone lactonase YvrE
VPSHEQTGTIVIPAGDTQLAIHTFCLDAEGRLLATCGGQRLEYVRGASGYEIKEVTDPAGIKVLSSSGGLLATWPLEVTPQAINVGPDGTIFAGGQGQLVKLDKNGKVLAAADAPNVAELPPLPEIPPPPAKPDENDPLAAEKEKEKAAQLKVLNEQKAESQKEVQEVYARMQKLQGPEEEAAKAAAAAEFETALGRYQQIQLKIRALTIDPRTLAIQARSTALRKRAITGLAVTAQDVFVACPSAQGFGYDVWRTDHDFGGAEKIVTRLSGCCGQMDIQAHDGMLFVPENGRKRVICFDREGKQVYAWGESSRTDVVGFGSCCNPMNLRIGSDGVVYTSESNLGRVKRFTPDGEFLGVVGTVTIVPGCKHVAIAVSPDGKTVYMLDITRSHIVVMTEKPAAAKTAGATKPARGQG